MNPYDINDIARDNICRKAVRDAWTGADESQADLPVRFNDAQFGIAKVPATCKDRLQVQPSRHA